LAHQVVVCWSLHKIAQQFDINTYNATQVDKAHRIPNRNPNKNEAIVVQFKCRVDRDAWITARKKVVTNDAAFSNGNRKRIYINEHLTPYYKSLLWKTKEHAKLKGYKYVWIKNGRIAMRKAEGDKNVYTIRSELDLK